MSKQSSRKFKARSQTETRGGFGRRIRAAILSQDGGNGGTQPRRRRHPRSYWEAPSTTRQQGLGGRLLRGRFQ